MKDLSKIKTVLDLARDFESNGTDGKLAEGVKKTTKLLLEKKPETTFEDILMNLLLSARESYKHMIHSGEIDSTVDMFMNLVDMMAEEEGDSLEENEKDCVVSLISRNLLDALKEGLGHEFTEAEVVCLDERLNEFNLIGSAKKEYPAIEEMIRNCRGCCESPDARMMLTKELYMTRPVAPAKYTRK